MDRFIKGLMVNRAERQAVRDFCRAAVLLPFDMGRFQGDGGIIMAHIEAADRALYSYRRAAPAGENAGRALYGSACRSNPISSASSS